MAQLPRWLYVQASHLVGSKQAHLGDLGWLDVGYALSKTESDLFDGKIITLSFKQDRIQLAWWKIVSQYYMDFLICAQTHWLVKTDNCY